MATISPKIQITSAPNVKLNTIRKIKLTITTVKMNAIGDQL